MDRVGDETERDPDEPSSGNELAEPPFVVVKEEPNDDNFSDGSVNENSLKSSDEEEDRVGDVIERDPDEPDSGNELAEPPFVAVKDELNDDNFSDGSMNENSLKSSDEECVGERSSFLLISNEMNISRNINDSSCSQNKEEVTSSKITQSKGSGKMLQGLSKCRSKKEKMDTKMSDIDSVSTFEIMNMGKATEFASEENEQEQMEEESDGECGDIGMEKERARESEFAESRTGRDSCFPRANPKEKKLCSKYMKPYSCETCGKHFRFNSYLLAHRRMHTGEKPFTCSECHKSFSIRNSLNVHMRIHTGVRPYTCSVCGKTYINNGDLVTHKMVHNGVKPFDCSVCKKAFTRKGKLIRHMRTHTGEKPFKCSVCEKAFAQNGDLKSHMRTHTGEQPFECTICGKRFSKSGNLCSHTRHVHGAPE